ncbi:MAG TPA: flagellar hook-length control protein FliK [bacterium]|nr:flagellar hook-length control protein FliK [Myxococcales bacterium]OQA58839.1 MAG: Flagellar hook-length control protein FliK [bacterium ADurb.Bin270]HPW45441.1 flagellar hook-length control protein FliK [bacterium]
MVDSVERSDQLRAERMKELQKEKERPRQKESEFDQLLRQNQVPAKPIQTSQVESRVATEYAIKEAVKEEDRRGDDGKKDEKEEKEKGRDSKQESGRAEGKVADQKVIAKGRLRQGQQGFQGGRQGYGGSASSRKEMGKRLEKSGAKSLPLDLRGNFASKLVSAMKADDPSKNPAMSQQVLNKIVQYVKIGINKQGEKEIQVDLHERIFRGLKLRVIARGGKVAVRFASTDPKSREVLEKNRDGIQKALKDKGIDVEDIEIT